jgi:hypothetical protein
VAVAKKRRRFTKENWMKLVASIREQQKETAEPKKEEPKVEVHIHNNLPSFDREANSADISMQRMIGNNKAKWRPS